MIGYAPPPATPTRIVLPDGSKLSGDVLFTPGNNVGITHQANGALFFSNPAGPRRSLSVFAPGVITPKLLQDATIPNAVLQQLDVFLLTAPVGVTGAACGNVVVAGTVSGSATLPLQAAQAEWHLGPRDLGLPLANCVLQTYPGSIAHADATSAGVTSYPITPTADITVFNIGTDWVFSPSGQTAPRVLRIGICLGSPVVGQLPTVADPLRNGNGWLTGVDGYTPCWFEIDPNTIPNTQLTPNGQFWALPGTQGFKLLQGVNYSIIYMMTDGAGNPGNGNTRTNTEVAHGFGPPIYQNNASAGGRTVKQANFSAPNWGNWIDNGASGGSWQLYGGIVGLSIQGLVSVSTTLTGAPATPGSDVEIYAQL